MTRWIARILTGLAFALPMMLITVALVSANPETAIPADSETGECLTCHNDSYRSWQEGMHGQAATDGVFTAAWQAQGSPEQCLSCHTTGYDPATGAYKAEGVACEACHSPIPANHPKDPIPVYREASACGDCHTETFFEWQVSKHRENDLTCVACHDPHGTQLKTEDASTLCATCHRERASNFTHTAHSQDGLTCADCHLGSLDTALGEGHAARDHSFNVRLSTCNSCHEYQMHDPSTVHLQEATPTPEPDAMASAQTMGVTLEPEPASPMGFAALAGLIGFGVGAVLTPWLERWYRRNTHK